MKEENKIFDTSKFVTLHEKNLDWEKSRRWGRLLDKGSDFEMWLWNGNFYIMPPITLSHSQTLSNASETETMSHKTDTIKTVT